jgi:hypothetical protein
MSTKLTISIPDELARQLEPWRGRMNLSRISAEAIAEELAMLKGLPQEVQDKLTCRANAQPRDTG